MGFDEATKYTAGCASRLMAQGIKESLKDNPSYDEEDVGEIAQNARAIGPLELAELHAAKKKVRDELVKLYNSRKVSYQSATPAFGGVMIDDIIDELLGSMSTEAVQQDGSNSTTTAAAVEAVEDDRTTQQLQSPLRLPQPQPLPVTTTSLDHHHQDPPLLKWLRLCSRIYVPRNYKMDLLRS